MKPDCHGQSVSLTTGRFKKQLCSLTVAVCSKRLESNTSAAFRALTILVKAVFNLRPGIRYVSDLAFLCVTPSDLQLMEMVPS